MVSFMHSFAIWSFLFRDSTSRHIFDRSNIIKVKTGDNKCSGADEQTAGYCAEDNADIRKLMSLSLAHLYPSALRTFVDLDLANRLSSSVPKSIAELIHPNIGWNPDAIDRVLLVLSTQHVVERFTTPDGHSLYKGTRLSALLQAPGASSMVLHWSDPLFLSSWNQLTNYCRDASMNMFEFENSMSMSDWYAQNPASLRSANAFIDWNVQLELLACLEGYDWALLSGQTLLDLGGHDGKVLQAIVARFDDIRCICLDQKSVLDAVPAKNHQTVSYVTGDILDRSSWPACDVIFMKHIIYCDWDDEDSLHILKACSDHLPPGGRLIVGEMCRDDDPLSILSDMYMMLGQRAAALSQEQWKAVANSAGLELVYVTPTKTPTCSILVFHKQ